MKKVARNTKSCLWEALIKLVPKGPVIKYCGGLWNFFLSTGFQWPTPELFDKIGAAHPWSGTGKTSDPLPNQNQ